MGHIGLHMGMEKEGVMARVREEVLFLCWGSDES